MALIVLLTLGAAIGWLASIILKQDSVRESFTNIGIGTVGALVSFGLTSRDMGVNTIQPDSLLFGALGAAILLTLSNLLRQRILR